MIKQKKNRNMPVNKRKTYIFWQEMYKFFCEEKHTPIEVLNKIHELRDRFGGYKWGWISRYSHESLLQVITDKEKEKLKEKENET